MDLKAEVVYRAAQEGDAQEMVDFYNRAGGETTFLSFVEDEYPMNAQELGAYIEKIKTQPNATMLLATAEDKIVGIGGIRSETKIKSRHCGELGIVVAKAYQGQGIGSEIIQRLLDWCRGNGVTTKVQLDTRKDNEKAVALYQRFGFVIEGDLKNAALVDGQYRDVYIMGLML